MKSLEERKAARAADRKEVEENADFPHADFLAEGRENAAAAGETTSETPKMGDAARERKRAGEQAVGGAGWDAANTKSGDKSSKTPDK